MACTATVTTRLPDGTSTHVVDDIQAGEAARTRDLAAPVPHRTARAGRPRTGQLEAARSTHPSPRWTSISRGMCSMSIWWDRCASRGSTPPVFGPADRLPRPSDQAERCAARVRAGGSPTFGTDAHACHSGDGPESRGHCGHRGRRAAPASTAIAALELASIQDDTNTAPELAPPQDDTNTAPELAPPQDDTNTAPELAPPQDDTNTARSVNTPLPVRRPGDGREQRRERLRGMKSTAAGGSFPELHRVMDALRGTGRRRAAFAS
ncbi:hypothetical protein Aros01_08349 [Streptosporangium roseum]|uniref:Uncharacterized protein n=1 Tax=Streptosporangium roseum (strain ATCC 12428 / DSM 43021 / JCM 3005 / KCTC 9067 / NCIMB 10171 / NRRL 2505 / NI 9100) TaxID=479432 RepID=D2B5P1_STRRD|nr:hypothetical protein Sros_8708 [Streptosporangium roseum DSM 43021]